MTFLFLFWFVGVLSVVCEPENQLLVITMNVFTMQYVHFLNTNCIFTANSNNNWVIRVLIRGIIGGPRLEPGFESRDSPRFRPWRKTHFSILILSLQSMANCEHPYGFSNKMWFQLENSSKVDVAIIDIDKINISTNQYIGKMNIFLKKQYIA